MSRIYTPKDGYTTKSGAWTPGTDFVMMTASERAELYESLCNTELLKRESGITIPGWRKQDDKILRNAARLLAPVHRGGSNKDLTLPDLRKLWMTLDKLENPLKDQVGHRIEWPDCIIPDNYEKDGSPYYVSKTEVWEHMEAQRNSTKVQQDYQEYPSLCKDKLPNHADIFDAV